MNLRPQRHFSSKELRSTRGVALVITLILLAVIATLAIAFLGLTHRETGAVDAMSRTTDAELSADSALERVKAEILTPIRYRNPTNGNGSDILGPDMMVSVCCQNFDTAARRTIPYDRLDADQRITYRYDAAPPVFVDVNRPGQLGPRVPLDDRFFVDLNRNGFFEDSGLVRDLEVGRFGTNEINWRIGDPQWIGILQNPRRPHTNDNRFIGRYAFMVLPAGRSLDVNWIHNDAKSAGLYGVGQSGFVRNQGVGGFENNLAAFLCDLNANAWNSAPYVYSLNIATPNTGTAFDDAKQILYARNAKGNVNRMDQLFPPAAPVQGIIQNDGIDAFGNGSFQAIQATTWPWPGATPKTNLFSVHEFFDTSRIPRIAPSGFMDRMTNFSKNGNSYDRYTFYRMLSQMGTDSVEEKDEYEGKININYMNIRSWLTGDRILASDLISWTNSRMVSVPRLGKNVDMGRPGPELFFLSVVTNLLTREFPRRGMVTGDPNQPLNIPVFTNRSTISTNLPTPGPLYAGRIHQILQQAANIYDATTGSKIGEVLPYFPTIFRPVFTASNGNVFITDYRLVTESADQFFNLTRAKWRDLDSGDLISNSDEYELVYGIPLIIGARKGFPNFNEIGVISTAEATRKLTIFRSTAGAEAERTNQLFTLNISTKIQVEARNAYRTPYPRRLELQVGLRTGFQVTNSLVRLPYFSWPTGYSRTFSAGTWPGEPDKVDANNYNYVFSPIFETNVLNWATNTVPDRGGPTNMWAASITNRLLFFLVDRDPLVPGGRIVDAVTLNGPRQFFNVATNLASRLPGVAQPLANIWSSERASANLPHSLGIESQINVSRVARFSGNEDWGNYDGATIRNKDDAILNFNDFILQKKAGTNQVPFTPIRRMIQAYHYRVNDPLVHYTLEDLSNEYRRSETVRLTSSETNLVNMGARNPRSLAWNRGMIGESQSNPGDDLLDSTVRDPGVINSDYWDFPTNRFPNIGWLGRVHRGTPWQTIYLKSRGPKQPWKDYSGPMRDDRSADLMRPTRDWELLDIFTTSLHPNTTRGRLSINQTNLAAWSAAFAGAVTSATKDHIDDPSVAAPDLVVMEPVAVAPGIDQILAGINRHRTNFSYGQFKRLSQLMGVSELTDDSPFLNVDKTRFDARQPKGLSTITDADYERIPQQVLSLLKVGEPRFVVYAWGQSLKPARLGVPIRGGRIDPSLPLEGPSIDPGTKIVNNYQVTGEVATRSVVRVVFPEMLSLNPNDPNFNRTDYSKPHLVVESFNIIPIE